MIPQEAFSGNLSFMGTMNKTAIEPCKPGSSLSLPLQHWSPSPQVWSRLQRKVPLTFTSMSLTDKLCIAGITGWRKDITPSLKRACWISSLFSVKYWITNDLHPLISSFSQNKDAQPLNHPVHFLIPISNFKSLRFRSCKEYSNLRQVGANLHSSKNDSMLFIKITLQRLQP